MKSKMFTEALEKRGIHETVKKISGKPRRVFVGVVTRLQKNLNFDLPSYENKEFKTNMNFENSCNLVTSNSKNIPEVIELQGYKESESPSENEDLQQPEGNSCNFVTTENTSMR
jgi:hypothetical protein